MTRQFSKLIFVRKILFNLLSPPSPLVLKEKSKKRNKEMQDKHWKLYIPSNVHASWKKVACTCVLVFNKHCLQLTHKHDKYCLQTKGQKQTDKDIFECTWNSKLTHRKFIVVPVIVLLFLLVKKIGVNQDCHVFYCDIGPFN